MAHGDAKHNHRSNVLAWFHPLPRISDSAAVGVWLGLQLVSKALPIHPVSEGHPGSPQDGILGRLFPDNHPALAPEVFMYQGGGATPRAGQQDAENPHHLVHLDALQEAGQDGGGGPLRRRRDDLRAEEVRQRVPRRVACGAPSAGVARE